MGQVLHGCATTTEAVRRAIQHSQESLRVLAKRLRDQPEDGRQVEGARLGRPTVPTGPKEAKSTVLSIEDEAIVVAFRRHTLLPLDDCLYALQATRQAFLKRGFTPPYRAHERRPELQAARRLRWRGPSCRAAAHRGRGQRSRGRRRPARRSAPGRRPHRRPRLRQRRLPRRPRGQGNQTLHPAAQDPQGPACLRPRDLQAPPQGREHVRPPQGLAPRRHPLRSLRPHLHVSHRHRSHRHLLAEKLMSSEPRSAPPCPVPLS